MATPKQTVLRIKRKRDEEPLEVLLVPSASSTSSSSSSSSGPSSSSRQLDLSSKLAKTRLGEKPSVSKAVFRLVQSADAGTAKDPKFPLALSKKLPASKKKSHKGGKRHVQFSLDIVDLEAKRARISSLVSKQGKQGEEPQQKSSKPPPVLQPVNKEYEDLLADYYAATGGPKPMEDESDVVYDFYVYDPDASPDAMRSERLAEVDLLVPWTDELASEEEMEQHGSDSEREVDYPDTPSERGEEEDDLEDEVDQEIRRHMRRGNDLSDDDGESELPYIQSGRDDPYWNYLRKNRPDLYG